MKTTQQLQAENRAIREMLAAGPEEQLRSIPGVTHVSVGLKEKNGKATDQLCIRVYVREKKDPKEIPAGERIPAEINGVPTDVNTVGTFEFQLDSAEYRPIKGGIQITNRIIGLNDAGNGTQMSRGTMGCVAVDKTDNSAVLLTNWHVLTANGGRNGDKVFQPAPTSLPPLSLGDLPFRPRDDHAKIGVIRRNSVTDHVDGAIAAIDVSSCCHCCGIHYSNEINGLSVGGRPSRNTIVGDERVVSGMTVFKVGQSTLRTEGRVVDDNYPAFSITKDGTTHTFVGQIAIQNVDTTKPFSDHGDSGSVVINLDNKIVGLIFASGRNVPVQGVQQPFVSIANHISDVFSELNIRIDYSPDVVVISGAALGDFPPNEAAIPETYRDLRERIENTETTAALLGVARGHRGEIVRLVNHCRPVTVAWRRAQGPAWLATLIGAVRDGRHELPVAIQGVTLAQGLARMRAVLCQHGSAPLRESLERPEADRILEACRSSTNLSEMIDCFTCEGALNRR